MKLGWTALLLLASCASPAALPRERVDLIIRGGTIYTGSGAPFVGDVAVSGDRIRAVGRRLPHSAARLVDAMRHVERGELGDQAELEVLTADEYADINRGFGLMLDSLREEHRLLEVTQDLAGELLLEVLIGRIMTATTQLLGAERASIFVYDEKADELFSLYADGLEKAMKELSR